MPGEKRTRYAWQLGIALLAVGVLLLVVTAALAQGPAAGPHQAGYDLSWWTVDGGGSSPGGGTGYNLGGTAGQPDAGSLSAGGYTLGGGFWGGGVVVSSRYLIYLPLVLRAF